MTKAPKAKIKPKVLKLLNWECKTCKNQGYDFRASSKKKWTNHSMKIHKKGFECQPCEKICANGFVLKRHLQREHSRHIGFGRYQLIEPVWIKGRFRFCLICDKSLQSTEMIYGHETCAPSTVRHMHSEDGGDEHLPAYEDIEKSKTAKDILENLPLELPLIKSNDLIQIRFHEK